MDRDGSGRSLSIPLSKGVLCSFMAEVGSLLLVLELDDYFDFINAIVQTVSWIA